MLTEEIGVATGGSQDNAGGGSGGVPVNRPKVRSTPPPPPPKRAAPVRFASEKKVSVKPRRVRGGIKLGHAGAHKAGWIEQRVARLVEQAASGEAYREGREYAELGQTKRLVFEDGVVHASVQGRRDRPYTLSLRLEHFNSEQRERAVAAMAEQAVYAAKLLSGELPANIEDVFAPLGLRLLPADPADVTTTCTCSDWSKGSPWCKHAACVALLAAERLAGEPFLIFGLRGVPAGELLEQLREHRALPAKSGSPVPVYRAHVRGASDGQAESLEAGIERFWSAGPGLREVDTPVNKPEVPHLLLRRLGPSPLEGRFPLLGLLATCYELIGEEAVRHEEPDEGDAGGEAE